ncbi:MAG: reverse transcriptase domain-containing protein, partial [Halobacteriota archaeon]
EGGNEVSPRPQPSSAPSVHPSNEPCRSTEDPSAAAHNSDPTEYSPPPDCGTSYSPPPDCGTSFVPINLQEAGLRRSARLQAKRTARFAQGLIARSREFLFPASFIARTHAHLEQAFANRDATLNYAHPCAFQAKLADNEVFHYGQAKKQPDWPDFCKAMVAEICTLDRIWHLVPHAALGDAKVVKAIWSIKRKRSPDGTLLKHKARLCAHGGMQEHGEHYWDTYSPVVQWLTVRLMLTLSAILGLKSRLIDFTLAYTQADLDVDIYIEIPAGFVAPEEGDWVLKLDKNLYGLKQAGLNWFETLKDALESRGFRQSATDPCCFLKGDMVILVYVDDCLIFCPRSETIDAFIASLQQDFTLVDEGDVASYLGAEINTDKSGRLLIKQSFLMDRIIEALDLKDQRQHDTPAIDLLHQDTDGPIRKQDWSYPSLIGMLNYLSGQTRPDILFATHQCARFMKDPKLSHEIAAKRIVRYLKRTRESGLILQPDMSQGIKCYVDADFAGSWNKEDSADVASVYSRTGYVIMFANCPIMWVSKLQTEVALSTTEAEYIALSQAMRDVIPFMNLIQEISGSIYFDSMKPEIQVRRMKPEPNDLVCEVYEDNRGALELAKVPKMRPRTKHIALKYHHFREHVKNGLIRINPVDTKEQVADIFTKPLPRDAFRYLRNKLCGW